MQNVITIWVISKSSKWNQNTDMLLAGFMLYMLCYTKLLNQSNPIGTNCVYWCLNREIYFSRSNKTPDIRIKQKRNKPPGHYNIKSCTEFVSEIKALFHTQSRPAFSLSAIVLSCLDPPRHGGLLARLGLLLHCWGVLAWMARAWTQVLNSSFRASFTSRWRCRRDRPSNCGLTTRTLKWDSEPGGTACMWLSFSTSRCSGLRAWVSLVRMVVSTGREPLCSMWGWWCTSCLEKARLKQEGRRQRRPLDSIRE